MKVARHIGAWSTIEITDPSRRGRCDWNLVALRGKTPSADTLGVATKRKYHNVQILCGYIARLGYDSSHAQYLRVRKHSLRF
jgi:hypothetical protein